MGLGKKHSLIIFALIIGVLLSASCFAQGLASSNGVDLIRGAWSGTIIFSETEAQINLYFAEFGPDPNDPANPNVAVSSGFLSFTQPGKKKRPKATFTPMQARYNELGDGNFDITIVGTLITSQQSFIIRLTGKIQTFGSGVTDDDVVNGYWYIGENFGSWSANHLDRRKIKAPTIEIGDDLNFDADVYCVLIGPTGDPEIRNPGTLLGVSTNIVAANVEVDIPNDDSVIIPPFTDLFSPEVDFIDLFRFLDGEEGLPIEDQIYTFTGLDILGNPMPGVQNTDVYVGGNEPDPPTGTLATVTGNGIYVEWNPVTVILNSFDPEFGLGFYQIELREDGETETLYGANNIQIANHTIPLDDTGFTDKDFGDPLNELGDGNYIFDVIAFSVAPAGSNGKGLECQSRYPAESISFTINNGVITIP